jgi:sialate O-acetylesterase
MSSRTRLASLFTHHAILQAGHRCPVWGWDAPGRALSLRIGELVASTHADAEGRFRFELPALPPGGPHRLEVEGSSHVVLEDIWFGEVWLASGQSNMEWKVSASRDADAEAQSARWPLIRSFKVPPRPSLTPEAECGGGWVVCDPDSVCDFSAVGYYFARDIHRARQVPVGIIDATWGGTCIEAWTSLEALAGVLPDLDAQRAALGAQLGDLPRLRADYERAVTEWQRGHLPTDMSNQGLERGWTKADFDDAAWRTLALPTFWQAQGMAFNGVVWFRRAIELPRAWAGHELGLSLGAIDDFDDTYFDGALVGRTPPGTLDSHRLPRRYTIAAERASSGRHVVAVRVFDHFGGGGFAGPARQMFLECPALGERLPLAGPWRVQVEREIPLVPMNVFQSFPPPPLALALQHVPAALFQGMIAPLVPYAIRGALWYQGESNVDRHATYRALQLALMRDWRTRWGQGQFPFYYVQLANFTASATWPLLREAQAEAASEPATGMVVTLDIGDPSDIHPANKQEVGRRLALWARARTYGEASLAHAGPQLERVDIEGSRARVRFAHAEGLTTSDGQPPRGFTVAGPDGPHQPAKAHIEAGDVWLESPSVSCPRAVRYGFVDTFEANLQNAAGLPAAPFRTDPFAR